MKKYLLLTAVCFLLIPFSFSQAPEIEWQKTIGGLNEDLLHCIQQTTDGGYILGGESVSSNTIDKTEVSNGEYDYWVIKLNPSGEIEWQNTIGGNAHDRLDYLIQTPDGGYLVGGTSTSGISGDKTEACYGGNDYWIIKLSAAGEIEWQNTIGSSAEDYLTQMNFTSDGGYILGGYSYGGISGEKTMATFGTNDYWVIKINSVGEIEWQKAYGGSGSDQLSWIIQTSDGGYILVGESGSGISGNKTSVNFGFYDFWVLKLNTVGDILWQKSYGGDKTEIAHSIIEIGVVGYYISGHSSSGITGNKSELLIGGSDYWMIRINNVGDIEWQNTVGGSGVELLRAAAISADLGLIVGGESISGISGDKTEASQGGHDYWVVKLTPTGNIDWQNTIGGNLNDYLYSVQSTSDLGYVLGGYSASDISGDKIEDSNSFDYWIVKLESDCTPVTELCNQIDDNCNGLIDDAITETISISAGGPITFCQGGNVLLTATYSGATVQWKKNGVNIPGATSPTYLVNIKGTYTCVTTSPCGTALSSPILVNVIKNPPASITAGGATTFCAGGSVILTANAGGGLSYQWYKGASIIAGATSINYTATLAGNYKCRVTKTATGCFKNSNVIIVSVPCKEGELVNDENAFTIFPNPNDGTFTIEANVKTQDFASSESTIEIYNNLGQLIYSKEINSNDGLINENIEIKNIIPGIYLVKLLNNNIHNVKNIIIE